MNKVIKVVAVDDNEAVLGSVKNYFKDSENINVVAVFNNGAEALKYLTNNSKEYDLLLIDILLPQVDGIKILEDLKIYHVDGILLDLGVSSYQLDEADRGFSYMHDAKLDMRMNREDKFSAYDVVNKYDEDKLYRIFKDFGEEIALSDDDLPF